MDYETIVNTLTDRVKELERKDAFNNALLDLLADKKISISRNKEGEVCFETVEETDEKTNE